VDYAKLHHPPLGATANRARQVNVGRSRMSSRKNELLERGQIDLEQIYPFLETT
ncbi:uncharacterized protein METZ01_LOCUS8428, partial [marine metagenome]